MNLPYTPCSLQHLILISRRSSVGLGGWLLGTAPLQKYPDPRQLVAPTLRPQWLLGPHFEPDDAAFLTMAKLPCSACSPQQATPIY